MTTKISSLLPIALSILITRTSFAMANENDTLPPGVDFTYQKYITRAQDGYYERLNNNIYLIKDKDQKLLDKDNLHSSLILSGDAYAISSSIDWSSKNPLILNNVKIQENSSLLLEGFTVIQGGMLVSENATVHIANGNYHYIQEGQLGQSYNYIKNMALYGKVYIYPHKPYTNEALNSFIYHRASPPKPDSIPQQSLNTSPPQIAKPGVVLTSYIGNLAMAESAIVDMRIYQPGIQFNKLIIDTLSGDGTFFMNSSVTNGVSDYIQVTNQARGNLKLHINDSGIGNGSADNIPIIEIKKGDAIFELKNKNGIVEAGNWQYILKKQPRYAHTMWSLVKHTPVALQEESVVNHEEEESIEITQPTPLPRTQLNATSKQNLPPSDSSITQLLPESHSTVQTAQILPELKTDASTGITLPSTLHLLTPTPTSTSNLVQIQENPRLNQQDIPPKPQYKDCNAPILPFPPIAPIPHTALPQEGVIEPIAVEQPHLKQNQTDEASISPTDDAPQANQAALTQTTQEHIHHDPILPPTTRTGKQAEGVQTQEAQTVVKPALSTQHKAVITQDTDKAKNATSSTSPPTRGYDRAFLSQSANSVLNMADATPQMLFSELPTLQQRMLTTKRSGPLAVWTRYLQDNTHLNNRYNNALRSRLKGIQIGVDFTWPDTLGETTLGLFVSKSSAGISSGQRMSGKIDNLGGGIYGTWQQHNKGGFIDTLISVAYPTQTINTTMHNDQAVTGNYRMRALSAALETGWKFALNNQLQAIPYGRLSYIDLTNSDYALDNGMQVTLPQSSYWQSELGLTFQGNIDLSTINIKPHFSIAIARRHANNHLEINNESFGRYPSHNIMKYSAGVEIGVTKDISTFTEVSAQQGSKITTPNTLNFGVKIRF